MQCACTHRHRSLRGEPVGHLGELLHPVEGDISRQRIWILRLQREHHSIADASGREAGVATAREVRLDDRTHDTNGLPGAGRLGGGRAWGGEQGAGDFAGFRNAAEGRDDAVDLVGEAGLVAHPQPWLAELFEELTNAGARDS